jgi:flagellar basal-body rod protein FlgB
MFDKLTVLQMATKQMDWVAHRQEILSENIANINTPGYITRDVKPVDFQSVLRETGQAPAVLPVATDPRHIVPRLTDPNVVEVQKNKYDATPDGNTVGLEDQMAKVGEGQTTYAQAAALFAKHVSMLKLVTTGR